MEKLDSVKKKEIIQSIINMLSKSDPELYYTDTMTITSYVSDYIKEKNLKQSEYELVKDLSRDDIQILMSYNSNCC
jgi:hypothetical protein